MTSGNCDACGHPWGRHYGAPRGCSASVAIGPNHVVGTCNCASPRPWHPSQGEPDATVVSLQRCLAHPTEDLWTCPACIALDDAERDQPRPGEPHYEGSEP